MFAVEALTHKHSSGYSQTYIEMLAFGNPLLTVIHRWLSYQDLVKRFVMKKFERHEKTKVLVSDMVRHKPDCTATEDG